VSGRAEAVPEPTTVIDGSGGRRIGGPGIGRGRDEQVATSGPLPPPWRYDDHYGFGSLSCIE